MAERFVLDTSGWLALDEMEPGAEEVEAILVQAWARTLGLKLEPIRVMANSCGPPSVLGSSTAGL